MSATARPRDRLFRQDVWILTNALRATFSRWHDRVIAVLMMTGALVAIRVWFAGQAWNIAIWAALAGGIAAGFGAGRVVAGRLAFQAFDGLLAADALHGPARRRYAGRWHGVAIALLTVLAVIARPWVVPMAWCGYCLGALAAVLAGAPTLSDGQGGRWRQIVLHLANLRPGKALASRVRHPLAGAIAAIVLLLTALSLRSLELGAQLAIIGGESLVLACILSGMDDNVVRFMAITGHRPLRAVGYYAGAILTFAGLASPMIWFVLGASAGGLVAAVSAVLALLLALRVLAYRIHARRPADLLVALFAAALVLIGYSLPPALPFAVVALLWRMYRRADASTWCLA